MNRKKNAHKSTAELALEFVERELNRKAGEEMRMAAWQNRN
ncbi:MAG: hypothetical protein PHV74_00405 [Dehalococcoidia bacterium]|nr:hypothetical protein [Dehalococcoidia bacterium]